MNMVRMKSGGMALTDQDCDELRALASGADAGIDYSDIPLLAPEEWKNAVRGKFDNPARQPAANQD
ncbi:MAG: toxin-antitoxin system antitoxin subunit [Oxalobacter formigenes]|nr:toxin-antitoxin system antitoxin subunit [Oxalobacter formigenes]